MKPITLHLGFPDLTYEPLLDVARQTRVSEICLSLERIDGALIDAAIDSMAVEVGDMTLSYTQNILALKAEGDRLLRELSSLAQMPVLYNRFTGQNNRGLPLIDGLPNPYQLQQISTGGNSVYSIVSPYL